MENSVTSQMRYPQKRDVYASHYDAHSFINSCSSRKDRMLK